MKCLHLTLRLAQFCGRRETFADRLSIDLASQTEVGAVAGLVGLVAMTAWLPTATVDRCNGAAAKITHLQDLRQDAGALLFEAGEGLRQRAPPIRTYRYVRIIATKKENSEILPCVSRTQLPVQLPHSRRSVLPCSIQNTVVTLVDRGFEFPMGLRPTHSDESALLRSIDSLPTLHQSKVPCKTTWATLK